MKPDPQFEASLSRFKLIGLCNLERDWDKENTVKSVEFFSWDRKIRVIKEP